MFYYVGSEPLDSKLAAALELLSKERNMSKHQRTPMKCSPTLGIPWEAGMQADTWRAQYPKTSWSYNPWTSKQRDFRDVESDPYGFLISPPGEPIYAATEESALNSMLAAAEAHPTKPMHLAAKPMHRPGVHFIAEVPVGAKLLAFNDQIVVVAPGLTPHFVTLTGLTPVPRADGKAQ